LLEIKFQAVLRGESGYFFTPSGIVVLNTTLELSPALPGFFSDAIWGVQEHYRGGCSAASGFLCLTRGTRGFFKCFRGVGLTLWLQ